MINVLLAEDEDLELRALENDVDYVSLGMHIVGTARDGITAMELLKQCKPDVLISDIVMPKQSGLQLLRDAKKLFPDLFVVIISGHQSFEYAQKAIEYGVQYFLTKPFLPEQMYEVLTNISLKIQQRNRKRFEEQQFLQEWEKNLPLLQETFIHSLIKGGNQNNLDQRFSNYNIPLENAPLSAVCILPDERNDVTMMLLRKCVTAFFNKENRACACALMAPEYSFVLCVLFQCKKGDSINTLYDLTEQLRMSILADGSISVCIGMGSIGGGYADISICANQSLQALDYRYFLDDEKVVAFQDITSDEQNILSQQLRQIFPSVLLAVNRGDNATIDKVCDNLYQLAVTGNLPHQLLQNLFAELLSRIISYRYELMPDSYDSRNFSELYEQMLNAETPRDMVLLIRQELFTVHKSVDAHVVGRKEWLVNNIKEIIHNHYTEDISIDDIARQAFISTGYATRLFRKHTGESINNYLVQTRIDAAAKILKDPTASIGETAIKVGYKNIPYFSSVFRKKYGYTPREWRDMHAKIHEK